MKEMAQKTQQRQELKIWCDISISFTLKNALTRLLKNELSEIRNIKTKFRDLAGRHML
ncbi:hypothetical protein J7E63_21650 [Bacillus sp. ISL-75]|uniref:hypothetical protein n=1 Tax=Bacillus sp. ISL-75 TaxID=2819137 RepID=UPI001BE86E4E|nr:hypothetical protein [Bacillus sp. ISL-75]MBT2729501.1 hypothetical protein [Bacillus sp. ISL-75]